MCACVVDKYLDGRARVVWRALGLVVTLHGRYCYVVNNYLDRRPVWSWRILTLSGCFTRFAVSPVWLFKVVSY